MSFSDVPNRMTEPSIIAQNVRKSLVGPLNMYSSGERQPNFFLKKKFQLKKPIKIEIGGTGRFCFRAIAINAISDVVKN